MEPDPKRDHLEIFLREEHDALSAYVKRRMGAALLATTTPKDIFQEACLHAFQQIDKFQPGEHGRNSTRAWFRQILDRVVVTAARRNLGSDRKLHKGLQLLENDLLEASPLDRSTPSRKAAKAEAFQFLNDAVTSLPEAWRTVVVLFYFDHKPVAEIALQLGNTEVAVEALLKRARKALRDAMGRSSLYFLPPPKRRGNESQQP
jgi:RNA polymerase sigma-70 factor (ECF subfamily)